MSIIKADLQHLIDLGEAALVIPPDSPEFVDAIEVYAASFEEWFLKAQSFLTPELADDSDVSRLVEVHSTILDLAKSEQRTNSKNFWLHKEKARGIMAYTDILPKRMSISKTKKG